MFTSAMFRRKKHVFISNASTYNLKVSVSADICYDSEKEYGVNGDVAGVAGTGFQYKTKGTWEKAEKIGYSRISRQSSTKFAVDSERENAYITVSYSKKTNKKRKIKNICVAHPIAIGKGIIINAKGHIRDAKTKWLDTDGKNHKPIALVNRGSSDESSDDQASDNDCLEGNADDSSYRRDDKNILSDGLGDETNLSKGSGFTNALRDVPKSSAKLDFQFDKTPTKTSIQCTTDKSKIKDINRALKVGKGNTIPPKCPTRNTKESLKSERKTPAITDMIEDVKIVSENKSNKRNSPEAKSFLDFLVEAGNDGVEGLNNSGDFEKSRPRFGTRCDKTNVHSPVRHFTKESMTNDEISHPFALGKLFNLSRLKSSNPDTKENLEWHNTERRKLDDFISSSDSESSDDQMPRDLFGEQHSDYNHLRSKVNFREQINKTPDDSCFRFATKESDVKDVDKDYPLAFRKSNTTSKCRFPHTEKQLDNKRKGLNTTEDVTMLSDQEASIITNSFLDHFDRGRHRGIDSELQKFRDKLSAEADKTTLHSQPKNAFKRSPMEDVNFSNIFGMGNGIGFRITKGIDMPLRSIFSDNNVSDNPKSDFDRFKNNRLSFDWSADKESDDDFFDTDSSDDDSADENGSHHDSSSDDDFDRLRMLSLLKILS